MKKLIFVFAILLWSTYTVLSQDSIKKYSIGVDFNVGNNALGRKNIYPSIVLSKGKHSSTPFLSKQYSRNSSKCISKFIPEFLF